VSELRTVAVELVEEAQSLVQEIDEFDSPPSRAQIDRVQESLAPAEPHPDGDGRVVRGEGGGLSRRGVFGGKYMTDCRDEFQPAWFNGAKLATGAADNSQLLRDWRQSAAVGVAQDGLDTSSRSARLVSMVLSLLPGPTTPGGRCSPDQALESHSPPRASGPAQLRAR
jgi:hypothetical protein